MAYGQHTGRATDDWPERRNGGAFGEFRPDFGFKVGRSGAHTARTMMFADLRTLMTVAPESAARQGCQPAHLGGERPGQTHLVEPPPDRPASDLLRKRPNIKWGKDRGKNPPGSPRGEERDNDRHLALAEKRAAQGK